MSRIKEQPEVAPEVAFEQFCASKGIDLFDRHTKPVTDNCFDAVTSRSEALEKFIPLSSELKTLLLKTKDVTIAIHMPGDRRLIENKEAFKKIAKRGRYTFVENQVVGTLNPISLHLRGEKIIHYFDASLFEGGDKIYYTNMGVQTVGVGILSRYIEKIMDAVNGEKISGFTKIDLGEKAKDLARLKSYKASKNLSNNNPCTIRQILVGRSL